MKKGYQIIALSCTLYSWQVINTICMQVCSKSWVMITYVLNLWRNIESWYTAIYTIYIRASLVCKSYSIYLCFETLSYTLSYCMSRRKSKYTRNGHWWKKTKKPTCLCPRAPILHVWTWISNNIKVFQLSQLMHLKNKWILDYNPLTWFAKMRYAI